MQKLNLNKGWSLAYTSIERNSYQDYKALANEKLLADLPSDVRQPLIDAKIIKDPVLSEYSFESEWIESKCWWYSETINWPYK